MIKMNKKNAQFAEFIGIMLGDGSLSNTRLKISFNSRDDRKYLYHVRNMIKGLFGEYPILKFRKNEHTADLFIFKRKIIRFLLKEGGLILSPKWDRARIPPYIKGTLERSVLKGYFDTDGCLVITNNNGIKYPRLEMKVSPSPMQKQFISILRKNEFKFGVYNIGKGKVRIQLNGKRQLQRWVKMVGFSNQKHYEKSKLFIP